MILSVNELTFPQVVLESPKPVLVHFWAPWCGLCRLTLPLLTKVQGEWGDDLRLVSINADENLRLANTYRLRNLPTLLLLEKGQVINRLEDFRSREDLNQILDKISCHHFIQSA